MKKFLTIFLLSIAFFFCLNNVKAASVKAKITYNDVNLRTGPGTNHTYIRKLAINSEFDLVSTSKFADEKGCSDGWYKIYYSGTDVGYVCASYVTIITTEEIHDTPTTNCEKDLAGKGFPKSYWSSLCGLKSLHPNWNFEADVNGLDFATAVSKEKAINYII